MIIFAEEQKQYYTIEIYSKVELIFLHYSSIYEEYFHTGCH